MQSLREQMIDFANKKEKINNKLHTLESLRRCLMPPWPPPPLRL